MIFNLCVSASLRENEKSRKDAKKKTSLKIYDENYVRKQKFIK